MSRVRNPFPNNIIPTSRLSQPALNFLNAFVPLPNSPNNIYTFPNDSTTVDDQAVAKIDHTLSIANHLSGRLLYERNNSVNDIQSFSPHVVNQFTFGFNDITRNQLPHVPAQKSLVDLGTGFIRSAPGPIAYDTEVAGYFQGFRAICSTNIVSSCSIPMVSTGRTAPTA